MQTLIKWPGGKTSEYKIIERFIPSFNRYIEPFFGGGAVFFNIQPQIAIINDISENLMLFYEFIKKGNKKFKDFLYDLENEWTRIKELSMEKAEAIFPYYIKFKNNEITKKDFIYFINNCCNNLIETITLTSIIINDKSLFSFEIKRMVNDKIFRTLKNEENNKQALSIVNLIDNIITGFTSGYYMYMRNILNQIEKGNIKNVCNEFKIAIFYFVREFCYGSMFRYNKANEFNIPYGGIAYNGKDFRKKIDLIFSEETQKYFNTTDIFSEDFECILDMANEKDFIFIDPPYDTNFSEYENRIFGENDQRRLAKILHNIKANFLLIIKNSPLISELYQNNGYNVYAFDNKYSYCVKGRNDRNAVHLIITNYD